MGARNLRYSVFLSVLLHTLSVVIWVLLSKSENNPPASQKTVWIEVTPSKQSALIEDPKKRIVQTSPKEKIANPDPNAFLGQQSQKVDHETVNKEKTISLGSSPKTNSQPATPNEKVSPTLNQLGVPLFGSKSKPFIDEPNWATPGTRPQDFIEGMKQSDRTALNTKEYVFYGYFQRIRSRLDQAWVPILKEKLVTYYRSGRRLASDLDHITKVLVVLNEEGEIVRVRLMSESGTHDLDDAAVSAFNRAGPFPNPPKGMMDTNRQVQIPWDFILKT